MFKMSGVPIYASDDTSPGNRACSALAELFGFTTLAIVWFTAGKKSRFVGDHCRFAFYMRIVLVSVTAVFALLGFFLFWTVIVPLILVALEVVCIIAFLVISIIMAVRAENGRLTSKKQTRRDVRDYAFAGDENAISLMRSCPEYADILADYERVFATVGGFAGDDTISVI